MIGYEFEYCIRKGNSFIEPGDFEAFHDLLKQRGWSQKVDNDSGGILGSYKNNTFVGCDDCKSLMEVNFPPFNTINDCDRNMKEVLSELQYSWAQLGATIVFCGTFPGLFDVDECHETTGCKHPLVTNKAFVRYVAPLRQGAMHHSIFIIAGCHIWLDADPNDCIEQMNVFSRFSGIFTALCANGPVANDAQLPVLSGRDYMWKQFYSKSKHQHYDRNVYGLMDEPFTSLCDYFKHVLQGPFFFSSRDNKVFYTKDPSVTHLDFLRADQTLVVRADGTEEKLAPSLEDVRWAQNWTFPYARFKFSLREDVTLHQFLTALDSADDSALSACFSRTHFEIRSVAMQPQPDVSAPPAFALGLQNNFNKAKALADKYTYSFWTELLNVAIISGMDAKFDGVAIVDLAKEALIIAKEGLEMRNQNEGQYLAPLEKRCEEQNNPASEMLTMWEEEGLSAIFNNRDYC